jgi:hypothetical protein
MMNESLLQYYCASCGKIFSESSTQIQKEQIKEACPSCRASLSNTLQYMKLSLPLSQLQQEGTTSPPHHTHEHLSVEFQTAYKQIQDLGIRLAFDIKKIDLLLDLKANGTLCIIGEQKYTQILIDRLCVHSMLPKRYGGILYTLERAALIKSTPLGKTINTLKWLSKRQLTSLIIG